MADLTHNKMTAAEFFELPESNKIIELINGEVVVAPSPIDSHQAVLGNLHFSLRQQNPFGVWRFAPADVFLDERNITQPDMFWISDWNQDCHLIDGKYWHGTPDLVIEVLSPGTTRQDRQTKYQLYEKYGVREYWIVDAQELYIEVYGLRDEKFERLGLYGLGEKLVSPILNDQTLNVDALLKN